MNRPILIVFAAVLASLLAIKGNAQQRDGSVAGADLSSHALVTPDKIDWQDSPILPPGAKTAVLDGDPSKEGFFTIRAKFPAGYKIPPHTHPCPERITVLSGTFHLGMGEKFDSSAGKKLPAGSYASMPAEMKHFAWTDGETVVQLSSIGPWGVTYVNPADDPRKAAAAK